MLPRISFALIFATAAIQVAGGQTSADTLLRRGVIDRAEAGYYAAVRAHPHDPAARNALGRYLVSRGAMRVGATLIEEAVQFGLDKAVAGPELYNVYMDLGQYEKLNTLPMSPSLAGQRALFAWLAAHPSHVSAPDSTVLVAFNRARAPEYAGAVRIRVNGAATIAMILPEGQCGIHVADTTRIASKLRTFAADRLGPLVLRPAAADSIGFGRMSITNVPVMLEHLAGGVQATICLSALQRYAPTFDPRASLMTLRLSGVAPTPPAGSTSFPFLDADGRYAIAQGGGWAPLALPQIDSMLRQRRWTLDARRGEITVEP